MGNKTAIGTRVIHAGQAPCPTTGAITPPIYTSSTYVQSAPGEHQGFEYSRAQNPTRFAYERCLADLESASHAYAFASGLAAINAILELLQPQDHIILADDVYGGTFRLIDSIKQRAQKLRYTIVDTTDINQVKAAITPQTRLIWVETPSNPMLKITDLHAIANLASEHHLLTVCDTTFATPILQRPLEFGIDIVMHSATKYLNGHCDIINGILAVNRPDLAEQLEFIQYAAGAVASPFDCYLALRGLKTLAIRMRAHCDNARQLAPWLAQHSNVKKVYYPGLSEHPQHQLASQQQSDFGGMIAFEIAGGCVAAKKMLQSCRVFTLAESLGGVESLIEHPALMTHASVPAARRAQLGISDGLIRVSVGIEDINDLQADLDQALSYV